MSTQQAFLNEPFPRICFGDCEDSFLMFRWKANDFHLLSASGDSDGNAAEWISCTLIRAEREICLLIKSARHIHMGSLLDCTDRMRLKETQNDNEWEADSVFVRPKKSVNITLSPSRVCSTWGGALVLWCFRTLYDASTRPDMRKFNYVLRVGWRNDRQKMGWW